MLASRKRQSRTRTRRAKRESDPLPSDDPALRTTRMDPHRFLATHPGVWEGLLTTLQAYLRDLAASETLLARLRTARSTEEQEACTRRLAANAQARTAQLAMLQTFLVLCTAQRTDGEDEPPVSIH